MTATLALIELGQAGVARCLVIASDSRFGTTVIQESFRRLSEEALGAGLALPACALMICSAPDMNVLLRQGLARVGAQNALLVGPLCIAEHDEGTAQVLALARARTTPVIGLLESDWETAILLSLPRWRAAPRPELSTAERQPVFAGRALIPVSVARQPWAEDPEDNEFDGLLRVLAAHLLPLGMRELHGGISDGRYAPPAAPPRSLSDNPPAPRP